MKSIFICGSRQPGQRELDQAQYYVMKAHRLGATGFQIIAGDGYGIDAHVARYCQKFDIPFACFGASARPRNGVSKRLYERLSTPQAVSAHLIQQAETVICLNELDNRPLTLYARQLHKQVYIVGQTVQPVQLLLPLYSYQDFQRMRHLLAAFRTADLKKLAAYPMMGARCALPPNGYYTDQ